MGTRIATYLTALLLLGFLAGCEKSIDPATGATTTRATIPGTANKDAAWQERWQRCIHLIGELL